MSIHTLPDGLSSVFPGPQQASLEELTNREGI